MTTFVKDLDNFPRLFVIQKFILAFGAAASASASGGSSAPSGGSSAAGVSPLWVGGQPTAPSSGPYNLQITGSIYYTSTPNALAACSKATAAQQKKKIA
jgi:hypothetical protein